MSSDFVGLDGSFVECLWGSVELVQGKHFVPLKQPAAASIACSGRGQRVGGPGHPPEASTHPPHFPSMKRILDVFGVSRATLKGRPTVIDGQKIF